MRTELKTRTLSNKRNENQNQTETIATNHQIKKLTREKHKLERKRNKLRRNDERNTTQHQIICSRINILAKEIKRISKENTTRQQMKLIDNLNQAKKGNKFWKAAKILLNQNQKNNNYYQ